MQNVDIQVKAGKAVITIDLGARLGESKSKKTMIVATTEGNHEIGDTGIKLGLNAYIRKPA